MIGVTPERLARQIEAAKVPGAIMVSADYLLCDEDFLPVGEVKLAEPNPKLFKYLREKNNPFCHPLMMFHRQSALQSGGYRYERAQDYDLWLRLLEKGQLSHVPEILLKYRVRRGAISISFVDQQGQTRPAIQKQKQDPGLSSKSRKSPESQYFYRLGFAAWLSGHRFWAATYLASSAIRGNNVMRCVIAMILMILPQPLYLRLAGYQGVYKA